MVFPGFAVFCFAVFIPLFYSVFLGMTDWRGYGEIHMVWAQNFSKILFHDPVFWISLKNALLLAVLTMLIQHPVALLFAYLIAKVGGKREKLFRTLFFVPCVISTVVTSRMWVAFLSPTYGLVNHFLKAVGLGFLQTDWLSNQRTAIYALIFVIMWQGFGWAMLIYYSGIKGLPKDIMEAAKVDGANRFNLLWHITLPLLRPVIVVNLTVALISSFKQMETIFLTTNGGPGNTTQFIANYLYTEAFSAQKYGYANAISVLFVVICILATVILNHSLKRDAIES
ncbi:MAG: sugar ABC transporter permease [Oscillospiraceae bacterium]|jgi:raffinose/stachyose/melibiose transport system permease protein|nr:sugar ABC transporter permease [Oscillospiraceae bacterium]MCI1990372.1 sugar ABC transporter permease [Oscillospiraceae bacterium]MCI2034706.1 sugar ABC transporter permease [Oscillospiraceae bacterium]